MINLLSWHGGCNLTTCYGYSNISPPETGIQKTNTMPLNNASLGWLLALGIYDFDTWQHSRRVANIALSLARREDIKNKTSENVWYGALLHDIGKIYIPQKILQKPDKLVEEEWQIVKKHPTHAHDMLSTQNNIPSINDVVYCHHERWDGDGYPRGLRGNDIPIAARLFAVVDVWDALGSDRPYRPAWSQEKVREYIEKESGKHFDPRIADIFLKMDLDALHTTGKVH
ncbi:MAG: HD-GYP domain-containing protein [Chloroflexi bacterium]|nr:HD-GYP domain-containing protein [Chloroflexota bacterium]